MSNANNSSEGPSKAKLIGAIVLLVAAGGAAWWAATKGEDERFDRPAVCTQCAHECIIKVGPAAGEEEWPKECPSCHQKHLYLCQKCPKCGKPMPLMDPATGGFGTPTACPNCKARNWESST